MDFGRVFRRAAHAALLSLVALQFSAPILAQDPPEAPNRGVRRTDPVSDELNLQRGIAEFSAGRYTEAAATLDSARLAGAGAGYYRGLSLLALGRAEEAVAEFSRIRSERAAPPELTLDLGIAQLFAGDAASATGTLTEYVRANPTHNLGRFFLGVALSRQNRREEADREFAAVEGDPSLAPYMAAYRSNAPLPGQAPTVPTPEGMAAQQAPLIDRTPQAAQEPEPTGFMRLIDYKTDPNRKYNLTFMTAYEYDSNIPVLPNVFGLGSGIQTSDSRWLAALLGDYRIVQQQNFNLGVLGSVFENWHFNLNQYNVLNTGTGAYSNAAFGRFIAGVRYEFNETQLASNWFSSVHRLVPNFTMKEGEFGHTTVYYEFDDIKVNAPALIPAQIRNGVQNAAGITQAMYLFDQKGRFYLGYRYEGADTWGSDFDRNTNMVTTRIESPFFWKSVIDTEVRVFFDDYLHPNSLDFWGKARADTRVEYRAGWQKFLTRRLSFRLDYTYVNNTSNVSNLFDVHFYGYNRHILSSQLHFDF